MRSMLLEPGINNVIVRYEFYTAWSDIYCYTTQLQTPNTVSAISSHLGRLQSGISTNVVLRSLSAHHY